MDTHTVKQALPASVTGTKTKARRLRTIEEKTAIVKETLVPGASVADVARRHGVNANLLFTWRRLYEQGALEGHTRTPKSVKMLPVKVREPDDGRSAGTIEIEWPDRVRVRVVGDVSTKQLSAVLTALAQSR